MIAFASLATALTGVIAGMSGIQIGTSPPLLTSLSQSA
jgi:hypothetical protein